MYKFLKSLFLFLFLTVVLAVSTKIVLAGFHTSKTIFSSYQNYGTPRDLITLPDGNMWYADSSGNRIVKINTSGEILRTVGRSGTGEGEFSCTGHVTSITRDTDGYLYALDSCKVYKFDYNGGFISSWGGQGDTPGTGQLSDAYAIHFDSFSGELLVSDVNHSRIVRFSTTGTYLGEFGSVCTLVEPGNLDSGCTTLEDGKFRRPAGITTDSSGKIYVVDSDDHRVQVFTASREFSFKFGSSTPGDYEFIFPKDVEILSTGEIVVTSQNSQTIKEFTSGGVYITQWGISGTADQNFQRPEFLTKAADDSLWISDSFVKKFVHYSSSGSYIGYIGNSSSSIAGKFTTPYSVAFDSLGNMYILDSTGRVQKFDSNGDYISTVIAAGVLPSPAYNLAISPVSQNLFVSSVTTVFEYTLSGSLIGTLGNHGTNGAAAGTGDFNDARGMAFDSSGNIYVADMYNNRVQKFDPSLVNEVGGGFLSEMSFMGAGQTWKGDWSSETTYQTNDAVMFLGETYISIQDTNLNHEPSDAAWWQLWIPSGDGNISLPTSIFIDGSNNIYVSPNIASGGIGNEVLKIQKFNSSGVWQSTYLNKYGLAENVGGYIEVGNFYIDSLGNLYLPEPYFNHVYVYDSAGTLTETIGTSGSGEDQYDFPATVGKNPLTGDIVVVDQENHRIHILEVGVKINNLTSSVDILNTSNSLSLVKKTVDPGAETSDNLSAQMYFGDYVVSDFNVNLTSDRDWGTVNAVMLPDRSKSLLVNLNPVDAPGVSASHSLYITKQQGQTSVTICPNATTIAELTSGCTGAYTLNEGDASLSVETIGSQEYWKITGLTGTGGFSPVIQTFNLENPGSPVEDQTFNITITAKTDQGLTDTGYRGTVHFSTSPATSTLPADYSFTGTDNGVHTFTGLSFSEPGTYDLTVADTIDSARTQTIQIIVTAASPSPTPTPTPTPSPSDNSDSGSSSSGSSNVSTPVCTNQQPGTKAPYIWKTESLGNGRVRLYFTDADKPITDYHIVFGTKSGKYLYGGIAVARYGDGSLIVSQLKPGTKYFFKLIPYNGCASGNWSNEVAIRTSGFFSVLTNTVSKSVSKTVTKLTGTKLISPVPEKEEPASPSTSLVSPEPSVTQAVPEYQSNIVSTQPKENILTKILKFFGIK